MSLFGDIRLRVDSREVFLSSLQQAALGVVWGHGPSGVSRRQLIWLLWETDDDGPARHRLSQLMYALRRKTGIRNTLEPYGPNVAPNAEIESEPRILEHLISRLQLGDAVELVRKGFLQALGGRVTREFDDWRFARDLGFRAAVRNAATVEWSKAKAIGDSERACKSAEALFRLDPDNQEYLECVVRARLSAGLVQEANAALRGWEEAKGPKDGVSTSLRSLLREHRSSFTATRASFEHNFVGRAAELEILVASITCSQRDSLQALVVTGEPGIGKTRLVEEALKRTTSELRHTFRAKCGREEQHIPLLPLVDALRGSTNSDAVRGIPQPWRGVIGTILPELQGGQSNASEVDPGDASRRLLEAIRLLLEQFAKQGCTLWLDDYQWVDQTTATALEYCRRRWSSGSFTLILSSRPAVEVTSETARHLMAEMRGVGREIELTPLKDAESLNVATTILGKTIPKTKGMSFLKLTDNIPLYVVELSHELLHGRTDVDGIPNVPLSLAIQRIVDERLSLVPSSARYLLDLIATANGLPISLLKTITGQLPHEWLDDIETLHKLRLVIEDHRILRCRHELIRQGIYDRLSSASRLTLHRHMASCYERAAGDRYVDQIALHFDKGESRADAFEYACRAAVRAEDRGAYHEATRFLEIARRNAPTAREEVAAMAQEATIRYREAEFDRAAPLLGRTEQAYRKLLSPEKALIWGIRAVHAASDAGTINHSDALERLDGLLAECEHYYRWEEFVEGLECRLRIAERHNLIGEMANTVARLAPLCHIQEPRALLSQLLV